MYASNRINLVSTYKRLGKIDKAGETYSMVDSLILHSSLESVCNTWGNNIKGCPLFRRDGKWCWDGITFFVKGVLSVPEREENLRENGIAEANMHSGWRCFRGGWQIEFAPEPMPVQENLLDKIVSCAGRSDLETLAESTALLSCHYCQFRNKEPAWKVSWSKSNGMLELLNI